MNRNPGELLKLFDRIEVDGRCQSWCVMSFYWIRVLALSSKRFYDRRTDTCSPSFYHKCSSPEPLIAVKTASTNWLRKSHSLRIYTIPGTIVRRRINHAYWKVLLLFVALLPWSWDGVCEKWCQAIQVLSIEMPQKFQQETKSSQGCLDQGLS